MMTGNKRQQRNRHHSQQNNFLQVTNALSCRFRIISSCYDTSAESITLLHGLVAFQGNPWVKHWDRRFLISSVGMYDTMCY